MNGIIAAIYASFTLAIGETSLKKSYRDFEPSIAFMFDAMMGVVFWIPLALLFGGSLGNFFIVLPYAIASAILSEASLSICEVHLASASPKSLASDCKIVSAAPGC